MPNDVAFSARSSSKSIKQLTLTQIVTVDVYLLTLHQVGRERILWCAILGLVLVVPFLMHCNSFLHCRLLRMPLLSEQLSLQTLGLLGDS